ncbi:MAG: stage II sporulation protein P [Oscillospiraceae bacterium]|nr:stage II sporulation protein P [Oscillospiraceae bacterium]
MKTKHRKRAAPRRAFLRLVCGITAIAACCVLIRGVAEKGSLAAFDGDKLMSSAADGIKELCDKKDNVPTAFAALLMQSSVLRQYGNFDGVTESKKPSSKKPIYGTLYYDMPASQIENAEPHYPAEGYVRAEYEKKEAYINIKNNSGLEINAPELLREDLDFSVSGDSPSVLIIHTHSSEAFTPEGDDVYEASDIYRTQDSSKSVIALGGILTEELNGRGISAVHDTGVYDYPSYAGSYNRACDAIMGWLEKYPSISVVIDLHRDASEKNGSLDYKTTANIGGTECAQVSLVVGTNSAGLEHPNWRENLKFAMCLQCASESRYPSLMRQVTVSQNRYNQHATTGSLILEVGYCGNTLEEARRAVRLFADAAADVLLPQG